MERTDQVRKILSWYRAENPGVQTNLARILEHGRLAGTGKLVILPVDQGFEHGPGRSFGMNKAAYDPAYLFDLAIESGCNAYAAPLGLLEAAVVEYAGQIPIILKLNNHDVLLDERDPISALTSTPLDAVRLGCSAVGFTLYPGSAMRREMYEQLREVTEEAKSYGLPVIVWSYPRGSGISKEGETALDVVAYAAHIAAEMGADIIKVKLPSERIELAANKSAYEGNKIPAQKLADRVKHIVQSTFAGHRIVIFSGGPMQTDDVLMEEARAICEGGGFGSIMGRNAFQRSKEQAVSLLKQLMGIYAEG